MWIELSHRVGKSMIELTRRRSSLDQEQQQRFSMHEILEMFGEQRHYPIEQTW